MINSHGQELFCTTTEKAFNKKLESLNIDESTIEVIKEKRVIEKWQDTAKGVMLGKANKLKRESGTDCVLIAIGGKTNFRDRLALLHSKYKDREGSYRPPHLSEVRALLRSILPYEESVDMEADDIISMYQYKGREDQSYIVCTEDKDAKQTPGFLFNPRKLEIKDCSGFGSLELKVKTSASDKKTYSVDGKGRCWFYYQVVCGDKVDTYHPFVKKVSDLKFYQSFEGITTDKEAWELVAKFYKEEFGDCTEWTDWKGDTHEGTWVDILQVYADVVHMRRWDNDRIDVKSVLKKFEIIE